MVRGVALGICWRYILLSPRVFGFEVLFASDHHDILFRDRGRCCGTRCGGVAKVQRKCACPASSRSVSVHGRVPLGSTTAWVETGRIKMKTCTVDT